MNTQQKKAAPSSGKSGEVISILHENKSSKKSLKSNICSLIYDYRLGIFSICRFADRPQFRGTNKIGIFTGTACECWEKWGAIK